MATWMRNGAPGFRRISRGALPAPKKSATCLNSLRSSSALPDHHRRGCTARSPRQLCSFWRSAQPCSGAERTRPSPHSQASRASARSNRWTPRTFATRSSRDACLPLALSDLTGRQGALLGPGGAPAFHLASPVATVVLDTRPTLRWTALPGSPTYTVTLQDQSTGDTINSPPLQRTEWAARPPGGGAGARPPAAGVHTASNRSRGGERGRGGSAGGGGGAAGASGGFLGELPRGAPLWRVSVSARRRRG